MSTQKTLLTADEFYDFCCKNDGRYELVRGEVIELAPANDEHGEISSNIDTAFNSYSRRRGIGRTRVETGYRLEQNPDTVRGPDISLMLLPRGPGVTLTRRFVPNAPDIAVEVVSPSNTTAEMERKVREYLAAGSQRVWVVYPATPTSARRVAVHRADGGVITYTGDDVITDEELLPGFSLPLAEIFE
jgi:Uma2 family endonuclease